MALRVIGAARPVRDTGRNDRAEGTSRFTDYDRRKNRTNLILRYDAQGFGPELECEVDQIVDGRNRRDAVGRRLSGYRLRRRVPFPRHVAFRHGAFFHRPDGLAVGAIESVQDALLGGLSYGFDGPPVYKNVDQHGRARNVKIPDAVMDQLVMPPPPAGFQIHRYYALPEQAVSRTVAAVFIACGQLDRKIGKT